jgi:hypothetical protein
MMKLIPIVLLLSATVAAAGPDPQLATAKTVYLEPLDPLEGDRPVAACMAERLSTALPLEVVTDKAAADIVLRVKARIPGDIMRNSFGVYGTIELWATSPTGAKMWHGYTSESRTNNTLTLAPDKADVPCVLADAGINMLRKGMKKARSH